MHHDPTRRRPRLRARTHRAATRLGPTMVSVASAYAVTALVLVLALTVVLPVAARHEQVPSLGVAHTAAADVVGASPVAAALADRDDSVRPSRTMRRPVIRKAPRVARQVVMTPEAIEGALTVEADAHWAPDRTRVRLALSQLPPEQRAVLELGYYEGLSSTEIAARVSAPVGTVKSRVAAGLAKLRAGLDISYRGGGS